jgi:hypothetical protein
LDLEALARELGADYRIADLVARSAGAASAVPNGRNSRCGSGRHTQAGCGAKSHKKERHEFDVY